MARLVRRRVRRRRALVSRRFRKRSRTFRSRRVSSRRRRFSTRRRRRTSALPRTNAREYSFVITLDRYLPSEQTGGAGLPLEPQNWYLMRPSAIPIRPYPAFATLWKEWRLVKFLVAMRRRFPEPVEYQPTTGGGTVAASRLATNNIWWAPWAKFDKPMMAPRQVRSAVMLTGQWTVKKITQKIQKFSLVTAPGSMFTGPPQPDMIDRGAAPFTGAQFIAPATNLTWHAYPYWGQLPWTTFQAIDHIGSVQFAMNLGYICVENRSAVLPDALECRVKAYFVCRGRKNLGYIEDTTGGFTFSDRLHTASFNTDILKSVPVASRISHDLLQQETMGDPVLPEIVSGVRNIDNVVTSSH